MEKIKKLFICKSCGHTLPNSYSLRTVGYCFLCDPNITVGELYGKNKIIKTKSVKTN